MNVHSIRISISNLIVLFLFSLSNVGCAYSIQSPNAAIDYEFAIAKLKTDYGDSAASDATRCYRVMAEGGPFSAARKKIYDVLSQNNNINFDAYILIEAGQVSFGSYDVYFFGVKDRFIYSATANHNNPEFILQKTRVTDIDKNFVSLLNTKLNHPLVTSPPIERIATNARCEFVTIVNKYESYFFIDLQNVALTQFEFPNLTGNIQEKLLPGEEIMLNLYKFLDRYNSEATTTKK